MIECLQLTKRHGPNLAVDRLSFQVFPGRVTAFLGPNGAGKSTTIRLLLGLTRPTSGTALVRGRRYSSLDHPLRLVGAMVDGAGFHAGRSAANHLAYLAASNQIRTTRVQEVLDVTGLTKVGGRRVGTFSLGMKQRLGVAAALLGDPEILVLDEPANGLDPQGIAWLRDLLRSLAAEGRTVFLSSHLIGEVALTADHLVVIGQGRLLADASVQDLIDAARPGRRGCQSSSDSIDASAEAQSRDPAPRERALEDAYLALTESCVDFASERRGQ